MIMTDPIADMLTRIRNALQQKHETVSMPSSNEKKAIAKILKDEGYITDYAIEANGVKKTLTITIISILILIGGVFKVYTTLDVSEDVSPITLVKSIFELEKNNKLIYEVSSSPLKLISKENFDII